MATYPGVSYTLNGGYTDKDGKAACHTISGLTMPLLGPSPSMKISISNLIIKDSNIGSDATIHNAYNSGAFIAAADGGTVELKLINCHTNNVNVVGAEGGGTSAGSLVGYISMSGTNDGWGVRTLLIKDCTVTGGSVTSSKGNVGGIVGFCGISDTIGGSEFKIENCSVNGCQITGENAKKTGNIVGTVATGGTLIINNTTATNCTTGEAKTALTNVYGRIVDPDAVSATIVIINGTSYGKDGQIVSE